MPKKVVDAFAGAYYGKNLWEGIIDKIRVEKLVDGIIVEEGYDDYLPHLLSDHVPIYFDYNHKGSDYRVLFANTGSLIGARGITDNKADFGDITLGDLEEWSKELVRPLLRGMMKLIEDNRPVLVKAKTMSDFQKILDQANELLSREAPSKKHLMVEFNQAFTTDAYAVLKKLSMQKWFLSLDAAREATGRSTTTTNVTGAAGASGAVKATPIPERSPKITAPKDDDEDDEKLPTFKLNSRKVGTFDACKTKSWSVCSDNTIIKGPGFEADIVKSFRKVFLNPSTNQVYVSFNGGPNDHYFSLKDDGATNELREFLLLIQQTLAERAKDASSEKKAKKYRFRSNQIRALLAKPLKPRRRMAQREFSSRRDSPVMVRLLEQIIDAQDD